MTRLNTIHAKHFNSDGNDAINHVEMDKTKVITNAVDILLTENADLIVDIESGKKKRKELEGKIIEIANNKKLHIDDRTELIVGVHNYLFNYGKLQPLVEDEDVSDIDFTAYNHGIIKRNGVKELLPSKYLFGSERDFQRFAKTLIVRNEGIINENLSHERVADERYRLRINVAIPPRNLKYTSMNIRKHRQNPYTLDDLVNLGMINKEQKSFLLNIVRENKKFLLVGKGASGKTTLLRAMMMNADPLDTYLVMEKDTELYFNQNNFIQQRIKKENHGGITVTLGDLVKDGLTMSLDGYVVGEIVGDEAWHFINAGVTDHMVAGSLHALSAKDASNRLLSMVETFNPGPKSETILGLIARSLDYIIHMKDFKINEIAEVKGYDYDKNKVDTEIIDVGDVI
ncbi:MAG: CpaF family protein [Clostridiales bacterium]|nr:CpaF family protein [Clostridiales bacterium]